MSIQSITNTASTYAASNSSSTGKSKNATSSEATSNSDIAVVYEKSNVSKSSYKTDTKLVAQMKQAAEQRSNQLRDLVQNMLTKQGTKNVQSLDIYQALRTGKVSVDPTTAAQAAKDISENGYWGV